MFVWTECKHGAELGQTLSCIKLSLKQLEIPSSFFQQLGMERHLLFLARGHLSTTSELETLLQMDAG